MKERTKKQEAALQLITDYVQFLYDHEQLVRRMVESKWQEMLPEIEKTIDRKIEERIHKQEY